MFVVAVISQLNQIAIALPDEKEFNFKFILIMKIMSLIYVVNSFLMKIFYMIIVNTELTRIIHKS